MEPRARSHVTVAMTAKPKQKHRAPNAAPKPRLRGAKDARQTAVEPSAESLVPDALAETERIERQNDFA